VKLNQQPKTTSKSKKRVGRGYGSGKGGHTAGRGAKGLKARGKVGLTFTGTKMKKSFFKKIPLQRGKGKFKSLKASPVIIDLKYLNLLPKGTEVNVANLVKHRIVDPQAAKRYGVKILGNSELKVGLKVSLPCSKGAARLIEKAGGKVKVSKEEKAAKASQARQVKKKKPVVKSKPKPKAKPKAKA
jgi:large subunit ribosomal protein L15